MIPFATDLLRSKFGILMPGKQNDPFKFIYVKIIVVLVLNPCPCIINMESTAALIPFDRLFKFSVSELTENYRVNLFKKVKEENAELLGMFGGEEQFGVSESEAEAEAEGEGGMEEDSDDNTGDKDSSNEINRNIKSEKTPKKKQSTKVSRKMRELEYDYDDPFIDDSEITDVYQSVFELMRGGGGNGAGGEGELGVDESENDNGRVIVNTAPVRERNFFVYRGTMTPEILSKEFEIDVEELLEGEAAAASDEELEGEEGESGGKRIKKESKKRKASSNGGNGVAGKKMRTDKSATGTVKESKKLKEPKELKKKKPSDLIAQSVKKFNDLFSSEDANEKASVVPVFNVNGVDANLLELRGVLKRFRESAVGTPFSPGKFPSVLRPRLNESICSILRVCRPTPSVLFPAKLFPALASFLPFSPAALNKLLTKKILGPLMEGIEKNDLPKMYEGWRKMIEQRIIEGGFIEVPASVVSPAATAPQLISEQNSDILPPSPVKRRLKFSDEMRQQVFEIVRLESDLNNLFCLSNFMESSSAAVAPKSVQSELNLRKIVYQKLMNLSSETGNGNVSVPLLSTTEISKEFGVQKRKHEKKVIKSASEILFGESEVEELLKELDVRKETTSSINVAAAAVVVENQNTATQAAMDPLNLFNTEIHDNDSIINNINNPNNDNNRSNDQCNTSLIIESNQ